MGTPLKLKGLETFFFLIFFQIQLWFECLLELEIRNGLQVRIIKATASCILSLLDDGKTDCVLGRWLSVLHENLSSEWVWGQWGWEGERGKAQAEQEEGWLNVFVEGLGDFVNGFDDFEKRLAKFEEGLDEFVFVGGLDEFHVDRGHVLGWGIDFTGGVVGAEVLNLCKGFLPGLLHCPFFFSNWRKCLLVFRRYCCPWVLVWEILLLDASFVFLLMFVEGVLRFTGGVGGFLDLLG